MQTENNTSNSDNNSFEEWLKHILNGDSIRNFFVNNLKTIFIVALLCFAYIGNRYTCERQMSKINKMQLEIKELKYSILCTSTELMEISRQSNLNETLTKIDNTIKVSTTPPIKVTPK